MHSFQNHNETSSIMSMQYDLHTINDMNLNNSLLLYSKIIEELAYCGQSIQHNKIRHLLCLLHVRDMANLTPS